jgi:purine-binding chemotaxis protein CheW
MADQKTDQYILFTVAGTTYALPSHQVAHVEMVEQITRVPNAPAYVDGVVFSRGQVVPAVNLRARFGFERAAHDLRTRMVVVQSGGRSVGLLVDGCREFLSIPPAAIQAPGEGLSGLGARYITGIASFGARLVVILDLATLVDSAEPTLAA